jgi:hypothetical protein
MAEEAADESPLWRAALRPEQDRERLPIFSALAKDRYALGIESIYEGYLLHYGRPRMFAPADGDTALLLGDYLFAHGLVRIADFHLVEAVRDLAELISLCGQVRAEGREDDGAPWAATAALLGTGTLDEARSAFRDDRDSGPLLEVACEAAGAEPVERSLAAHLRRVG